MIKKVLIAEDYESINISVQESLKEIAVTNADYVSYCDEALKRIQKALQNDESYDLLITDLHFETDHNKQKINSGKELIAEAKKLQPDLKILVFSATGKPSTITTLFNEFEIDGYVSKGRHDTKELEKALHNIANNQRYFPHQNQALIRKKNAHDFNQFDITIITQLASGVRQKDIPAYLQQNGIQPSGLSSIEKRLNLIKDAYEFSTNEQLIAYCKDFGII